MSSDKQPTAETGRVVRADGTAVPGALVSVSWSEGPAPEIAVRTDEQGRFRFPLPAGRLRLKAVGRSGESGETELADGAEAAAVRIVVEGP